MNERKADLFVAAFTLAASFLSLVFFSLAWHRAFIEGRSFPVFAGYISTLPLIESVPFAWPYLVAGFVFSRRHHRRAAAGWTLAVGVLGTVLHSCLVRADFLPGASLHSYIHFYSRFAAAPAFALVGFCVGQIRSTRNERSA
jgi:Na+(H+)/acetate symporter ActP